MTNQNMDLKNFYLQKIGQRKGIDIWIVDGAKIRQNLDAEFTNFGQHYEFPCIPEKEFWIDKEAHPNERRFFINRLFMEWQMMREGRSQREALDTANEKEKEMRSRARDILNILSGDEKLWKEKVHKRLSGKTKEGLEIWVVDGRIVRSVFDVNFVEGGHDLVYDYVYKNEVWLDDDLMHQERPYILLHELYERSLMTKGMVYDDAHNQASELEQKARNDSNILNQNLELLGWKSGNHNSAAESAPDKK